MNEKLKILVVDDEESIGDVFQQYLEAVGDYRVFKATDGHRALEMLKREEIDCCFTDLSMPRMDGIELTRQIHSYNNTIPVVVMTGYPSIENVINTLKNGVVDFLTKPVKMEELLPTIGRVMRERALYVDNILLNEEVRKGRELVRINEELKGKLKDVESMNLILQKLNQVTSGKDIFNILVHLSGEITGCDEAHFILLHREATDRSTIASFSREGTALHRGIVQIPEDIMKRVLKDAMPCLIRESNGQGSVAVVPLKIRSQVFGILVSLFRNGKRHFNEKDLYFLNVLVEKVASSIEHLALYENIYESFFSTLYAFVETIEAKDPYTKQHSTRVSQYAVSFAEALGCSQEELDALNVSGNLHDIGKIGIPDSILMKPDRLTDEEYEIVKRHPVIGSQIIGHLGMWTREQRIIRHHHERWDGKGYPDGLKGEEIPFLSRIMCVADAYDAMTSDRSYRKRLTKEKAVRIIDENGGSQFDPQIVQVFTQLFTREEVGTPGRGHDQDRPRTLGLFGQ